LIHAKCAPRCRRNSNAALSWLDREEITYLLMDGLEPTAALQQVFDAKAEFGDES